MLAPTEQTTPPSDGLKPSGSEAGVGPSVDGSAASLIYQNTYSPAERTASNPGRWLERSAKGSTPHATIMAEVGVQWIGDLWTRERVVVVGVLFPHLLARVIGYGERKAVAARMGVSEAVFHKWMNPRAKRPFPIERIADLLRALRPDAALELLAALLRDAPVLLAHASTVERAAVAKHGARNLMKEADTRVAEVENLHIAIEDGQRVDRESALAAGDRLVSCALSWREALDRLTRAGRERAA